MGRLNRDSVIITAALPYANADLHLGHAASTYIPPDILRRYLKLKGRKVVHVCASDDYGTPILLAAEKEGKTPSEYVAVWNERFKQDLGSLGIVYDLFDRTSSAENVSLVQDFFTKLHANGLVYPADVDQFYCENDQKFLPDRYVKGSCPYCGAQDQYSDGCENCGRTLQPGQILEPRCAICGTPPVKKKGKHYFFKLSGLSGQIRDWLVGNANLQDEAKNYVLNWISDGLQDWDVTRDIPWGVPLPLGDAKGQVLYGWFDNHLCYISTALKAAGKGGKEGVDFWNASTIYHFIGKDIVYHHYLFLPGMRIGDGRFRLPDYIPVRGHLLLQGKKISKSRHWSITIRDFVARFPPDYLRFYLTRIVPYNQSDSHFSWEEFGEKINNELVANIGNFAYRSLVFVKNKHASVVPQPGAAGDEERSVLKNLERAAADVESLIEQGHYDRALKAVLEFSTKCNQYFQHKAPWEGRDEPTTTFYACSLAANLAVLLHPFLPFSSQELWRQLGLAGEVGEAGWGGATAANVKAGQKIAEPKPLYRKIEPEELASAAKMLG